jgi:hypothetical protein
LIPFYTYRVEASNTLANGIDDLVQIILTVSALRYSRVLNSFKAVMGGA